MAWSEAARQAALLARKRRAHPKPVYVRRTASRAAKALAQKAEEILIISEGGE